MSIDNVKVTAQPFGAFMASRSGMAATLAVTPPTFEIAPGLQGMVVLTWTAVLGDTYRLQYTDHLEAAEWMDATPEIIATEPVVTVTNDVSAVTQRFYRVVRLPSLPAENL
jgi:hypothetical protein